MRAPIDGTIVEKLIVAGTTARRRDDAVLHDRRSRTVWVMANVFANDLEDVAVGQPVDVITDASARRRCPGASTTSRRSPIRARRRCSVRVVVPNDEPRAATRHVRARADQVGARASRHPRARRRRCCATIRTCRTCSSSPAATAFARRKITLGNSRRRHVRNHLRPRRWRPGRRGRRALPAVRGERSERADTSSAEHVPAERRRVDGAAQFNDSSKRPSDNRSSSRLSRSASSPSASFRSSGCRSTPIPTCRRSRSSSDLGVAGPRRRGSRAPRSPCRSRPR